ncbi:MAG: nicotinamide riboside transporter PnuC [Pseudomonas sp.]|uniref:nicotinamide riboside transporter PnuC n=1 Tax=Pseudomonas abieticivorans TaxID=2931382 RepID=UPI0020BE44BB|nr:nicotinamide riboside transporter PnuC [Pseudomonas sp. PIA16]MDE1169453.1 nicotinamide riboside transporter PnuC [Pseudomonas sp.]
MSNLEILAVLVNVLGVWLTARRTAWCWPVNVVAVLLYVWIFYDVKLYSDMLLQVLFAFLQGYGWWRWHTGRMDQGKVRVERLPAKLALLSLVIGALLSLLLGTAMAHFTDAAVPWLDATLTGYSLVASYWAARKFVASWWLWIVLDAVYTGLYYYKALPLTAALYAGFIGLAIYGLRAWQRDLAQQPAQPGTLEPSL